LFDDSDPVVGINYPITDVEITVAIDAHNENGPPATVCILPQQAAH
jgi:hypothetical protein